MKNIILKNGQIAEVSFISESDTAKELRSFINPFIEENAYILLDGKVSLKQEQEWLNGELHMQKKRQSYLLVARINGRIAATSEARRERFRCRNNVCLGIAVAMQYRGLGLGEALLKQNIFIAKKKLKAKLIYLTVLEDNKKAILLYKKLGFEEVGRLPEWVPFGGKRIDLIFMKYAGS